MDNQIASDKVLSAMIALKEKSKATDGITDKGVDLISIVKKLSRNRERSAKNK